MSEYKYLDTFPQSLKDCIVKDRCLPFIGSGFSINADFPLGKSMPTWEDLGKAFAGEMVDYMFSNSIDAISAYEYSFSRPVMTEKLKDFLLTGIAKPGKAHEAFCKLQFDIVCTTNFDHLLEDGYRKISKPCRPIISESQLSIAPMKDELTLLKIHGDIEYPDRIVATEADYDNFLDNNPMFATYLSNLLITRTPLFIGYSLDDDDFRQIWQIVKNRLGKMTRQAYVIKVGCSETERARYERRGVKVVNLEGNIKDYPQILADLFDEIKSYWNDNVKTVADNSVMSELALPKGSATRLCFFSAPMDIMPFYKDVVFPIAFRYGFIPITAESVVTSSDNWMAKISTLISKIDYFIVDNSSTYTQYELLQILAMGKIKENILVLMKDGHLSGRGKYNNVISRKDDIFDNPDPYVTKIEEWFHKVSNKLNKATLKEPERLLVKKEYNAAAISAIVHLEVSLRKSIERRSNGRFYSKGLYDIVLLAVEMKVVKKEDLEKLRSWIKLRNSLVHSGLTLSAEEATEVVEDVMQFSDSLNK